MPCQLLAKAQSQMALLLSGGAPAEIESPQLGRVRFSQSDDPIGSLQRYIDQLTSECALATGDMATYYRTRRRPISMEAWP